jgi:hypothetical protein
MKTDNQRREFEFALETLLKATNSKIKSVKVNWDEMDTKFRESAESVTITYNNDYKKEINIACCSWKAIAFTTIHRS